jgi:hypothetical protein
MLSAFHVLVGHKYGTDHHHPGEGEIIVIRLSEDLFDQALSLNESHSTISY